MKLLVEIPENLLPRLQSALDALPTIRNKIRMNAQVFGGWSAAAMSDQVEIARQILDVTVRAITARVPRKGRGGPAKPVASGRG